MPVSATATPGHTNGLFVSVVQQPPLHDVVVCLTDTSNVAPTIAATAMDAFGDYDFDAHPFAGLGGFEQARRVFGGQTALDRLIAGFNAAVFGQAGRSDAESGDDRAAR